ncbi:MAG TPA: hypothetical protein VGG46_06630 [Terriglobales bacterium]|jgi:uncharacterized membrane protein YhaH (DUF805 family)
MAHLLLATEFVSSIALSLNSTADKGVAFLVVLLQSDEKRDDLFNILWALVFGFATINILSLAVKRFDANKKRMSFGEILAVLVVIAAAGMLGWELLYTFHVLPIKLD